LTSAYIINPSLKPNKPKPIEEDFQDAKLLFYHPDTIQLNDKRSHVGISEGVVQFFGLFAETKGYMLINSQNYTHVMKEVEPNYWLNLIFFHKELFDPAEEDLEAKSHNKFSQIEDSFYENIISHCYSIFSLFHGSFDMLFKQKTREETSILLKDYFIGYAKEFINAFSIDYFPWNINGFCYCPIDKKNFMRSQLFLNRIKEKFSFVKHSMLLYSSYMIFNDLPLNHAKTIYTYLTGVTQKRPKLKARILGYDSPAVNDEKQKREKEKAIKPSANLGTTNQNQEKTDAIMISPEPLSPAFRVWQIEGVDKNGFLVGPIFGLPNQDIYCYMPRIYLDGKPYRMVIFAMVGLITCLFLEDNESVLMNVKILSKLNAHISKQSKELCKWIIPFVKKAEEIPDAYAYFYYNYVNNAIKISSKLTNDEMRKMELAVILNNMHEALNPKSRETREEASLCAYKASGYWVVTFKILDRELCVLLNSLVPLERIEEERTKFLQGFSNSIFVL